MLTYILATLLLVALAWLAWTWNRLVALRAAMKAAWASVDALLKRRAELIPNLVAVVRGYMDYEADTLKQVTHARTSAEAAAANPDDVAARARAESLLTGTVRHLLALVESYPDLKANQAILKFQEQLTSTEDDIASARRYYNAVVRDYNILRETFPTMLVASSFGFAEGTYFEAGDGDRMLPSAGLEPT